MNLQATIDSITSLPIEARLHVVSAVWDSLPQDGSDLDLLTPEQRAEIDRRLDATDANPDQLLTREELQQRLREGE